MLDRHSFTKDASGGMCRAQFTQYTTLSLRLRTLWERQPLAAPQFTQPTRLSLRPMTTATQRHYCHSAYAASLASQAPQLYTCVHTLSTAMPDPKPVSHSKPDGHPVDIGSEISPSSLAYQLQAKDLGNISRLLNLCFMFS